jgi:hypothetical protein
MIEPGTELPHSLPVSRQHKELPFKRGRPRKSPTDKLDSYLAGLARRREQYAAFRANNPKQKTGPKPMSDDERAARRRENNRVQYEKKKADDDRWKSILAAKRASRMANPEREREKRARRWAKPEHRLSGAMRSRMRNAFAHAKAILGSDKNGRPWETLVGYSVADLTAHIERQFRGRMSWANFGKWHVDHIVPVASFTFRSVDDPEFRACWALTNLRPMWAKRNLSKAAKRLTLL